MNPEPQSAAHQPFGNCKDAALQYLGSIQANGVLVAVHSRSHVVEYCSANSAELLGIGPTELLGRTGVQWLGNCWPAMPDMVNEDGILDSHRFVDSENLVVTGHRSGSHLIFEFEPAENPTSDWWTHANRTRFLQQLNGCYTVEQCNEFLALQVFELSGFDRVMMYRFLPDWHGEVVHERLRPGVEGFLGLRFPAADIPPNARKLFTLNWQRAIADVDTADWPVLKWNDAAEPLDLTYSTLRSPHPVHILYLRNMGVQASMTLSIVVNGKLWGMVACHHLSARALPIEQRLAFEEMARLVSAHLKNLLAVIGQKAHAQMRQDLSRLQGAMSTSCDFPRTALSHNLGMVRQMFGAGGAWLRFEGEDFFTGLVPDKLALAPLRDFLERFSREEISFYDSLPEALQPYRALSANASGLLFIPLGSADFIALMRPEVISTVNWAGKPEALEESPGPAARALTPRNSFAVWSQSVKNTSEPWSSGDVEFGTQLRTDLQTFLGTSRLEQIALHDALTGLANRLLFERRLQQEVRHSMARNSTFAVHMIDLDKFKQVNDTFGHAAGDQLLKQVAERLTGIVRRGDTVARLGGDEFAIIQAALDDRASALSAANRIVAAVSEPYRINGQGVEVGTSVGVAICPADAAEESDLLECADLALYRVKRSGRNASSMFDPGMRNSQSRGSDKELLAQALCDKEFVLHYQPIVDARAGELRGFEAFLRWNKPGQDRIPAGDFIRLVEQKGLAPGFAEWVMEEVFRQYGQWLREGLSMVPVTINVGTAEFATLDLLGRIESLAARYGTGWQWLRLDIKEQSLLADVGYAIRKLGKLREAGVSANLDNFGRGFVPLGYLTQLPFRGIKLDAMLFDHKSGRQSFDAMFSIVRSVAQVFSAQLTVTRVETPAMRDRLRNAGIDCMQGYAIARPLEAAQAAEWLRSPQPVFTGDPVPNEQFPALPEGTAEGRAFEEQLLAFPQNRDNVDEPSLAEGERSDQTPSTPCGKR